MDRGEWLTVGLHPTSDRIRVVAASTMALEACPANLDGRLDERGGSWPSGAFRRCVALDPAGRVALPATNGDYHVAFALRARSVGVTKRVTLSYTANDSFVEVILPAHRSRGGVVTFTPRTTTVGAVGSIRSPGTGARGEHLELRQATGLLSAEAPCDFGSEINCVGGVQPGRTLTVRVHEEGPTGAELAIALTWY